MLKGLIGGFLSLGTGPDSSLEDRRLAQSVNGFGSVGIAFFLVFGTASLLRGETILAIVDAAALLTVLVLLVRFWITGRFDPGALIGVILLGIAFLFYVVFASRDQNSHLWMYVYPLMCTYLLGSRKGIVVSTALLVLVCVYFALDSLVEGWAHYSVGFEIRFTSSYILVSLFSHIYERMRHEADRVLQATVAELTEAQQNLSASNQRLLDEVRQRKQAVSEMERATAEANRANQAKSQFLASMSHELRTPLNHVIGFSEIVLGEKVGELNEVQKEYLGDALSSSRHLLSIINDILDLSRVEAGRVDLVYEEVDPRPLLRESLRIVEDQAEAGDVELRVDVDGLPSIIVVDERMIRQVIYNLLYNAVKFTKKGGFVELSAAVSGDALHIRVTDSGIGIESGDLGRIFDSFEQIDGEDRKAQGGTGLGLALCRRFVELHGGRIWAESDGIGKGATFVVELPTAGPVGAG